MSQIFNTQTMNSVRSELQRYKVQTTSVCGKNLVPFSKYKQTTLLLMVCVCTVTTTLFK